MDKEYRKIGDDTYEVIEDLILSDKRYVLLSNVSVNNDFNLGIDDGVNITTINNLIEYDDAWTGILNKQLGKQK